jgi:hypothetical protein
MPRPIPVLLELMHIFVRQKGNRPFASDGIAGEYLNPTNIGVGNAAQGASGILDERDGERTGQFAAESRGDIRIGAMRASSLSRSRSSMESPSFTTMFNGDTSATGTATAPIVGTDGLTGDQRDSTRWLGLREKEQRHACDKRKDRNPVERHEMVHSGMYCSMRVRTCYNSGYARVTRSSTCCR